jgi:hypothetical protein
MIYLDKEYKTSEIKKRLLVAARRPRQLHLSIFLLKDFLIFLKIKPFEYFSFNVAHHQVM